MKNELIGSCPVCNDKLIITEVSCDKCRTVIKSKFVPDKFSQMTKQQKYFAEVFIKNRGNIKEIEKELGISYPTVRNKLDEVISALGYSVDSSSAVNRKEILEKLSKGELSKDEAFKMLNE